MEYDVKYGTILVEKVKPDSKVYSNMLSLNECQIASVLTIWHG